MRPVCICFSCTALSAHNYILDLLTDGLLLLDSSRHFFTILLSLSYILHCKVQARVLSERIVPVHYIVKKRETKNAALLQGNRQDAIVNFDV